MAFERIGSEDVWEGHVAAVRIDTFRYDDGGEARREIVVHPGAVTILPFDGEQIWMVRQPREPVGEPALLELPAGKLDVGGEPLLETAKRELAEEIGKGAREWAPITSIYNSPGILSEENHLFFAHDLYDEERDSGEEERIEIVTVPVADLDATIAGVKDAKTLIGLLWVRAYLR
jgi:ADP-ribose pyrophosphatase